MRNALALALLLAGCHRAQPSDVGGMAVKTAGGDAIAAAAAQGQKASPQAISPAVHGAPYKLQ